MTAGERQQTRSASVRRQAAIVIAACEAIAVAMWLLPGAVRIVDWPAAGPGRIALLAGGLRLSILTAVAAALAALAWWASPDRRRLADRLAPWTLLWLWAVPYLPWLPDRLPLLLVLDGPLRWAIVLVAAAGTLRAASLHGTESAVRIRRPGRRAIFAVSLGIYLSFGALSARALGPGGDEPHYLVIAHSLLTDRDLQIENNHREEDYRPFFNAVLRPDYLTRGRNGEVYSIHAPGLPALLLAPYALAGYAGTVAFLCLIAALTALAVYDLARHVAGERAAIVTWASVCLSVPFIPHAWLIFPEMPGALIVAWGALWLWRPHEADAGWWWRGAAIGALPWLHTKFVVFLAIFVVALGLRLRHRVRAVIALLAPVAVSAAGWLLSFYLIYGTIDPEAPYGDYARLYVINENIPRGLLGLAFDQKFGLLLHAPIYLAAAAGSWYLLRDGNARYFAALLILISAAFAGSTSRLYMWWGGSSAPARFLVPVLPCLAPLVAAAVARATGTLGRTLIWTSAAIGVAIACVSSVWPEELYLYSDARGYGRIVETLQAGAPLAATLPSFTFEDWVTPTIALARWLAAAFVGILAMAAAARRHRSGPLTALTTGSLAFLVIAALLTARPDAATREATSARGRRDLIWAFDSSRHWPFAVKERRRLSAQELLTRAALTQPAAPAGPLALPPGRYEARVWFAGTRPRGGEIVVSSSPTLIYGKTDGPLANPAIVPFRLLVESSRVTVSVPDEGLAAAVTRIDVIPIDVVPAGARTDVPVRTVESIPSWPDAFLVYTDEHAYPEGGVFWTRGTSATTVMVAPGGASRLNLVLHLGPLSGRVAISVAGRDYSAMVAANGVTVVEAPVPAGVDLVPITVAAPDFFRPAEWDPSSRDTRGLGCQVRVELG